MYAPDRRTLAKLSIMASKQDTMVAATLDTQRSTLAPVFARAAACRISCTVLAVGHRGHNTLLLQIRHNCTTMLHLPYAGG